MQLDQQSAVILSFPRNCGPNAEIRARRMSLDSGRLTNLAFMVIVMALAALWIMFPPAQLSSPPAPQAALAQGVPAQGALAQDLRARNALR